MIVTDDLLTTYRQDGLNLCAIAAFAVATFPFCQRKTEDFLSDFWGIYNHGRPVPSPDALRVYYDKNAEACFESFKFKFGSTRQMVHWFEFLGKNTQAASFNAFSSRCEFQVVPDEAEFSLRLREDVAVGYVGIAVRCPNTGQPLAHYISVWFDGNEFCMRDSRCGGDNPVDARDGSVEMLVRKCGVVAEYGMIAWWSVLIRARNV